MTEFERSKVLFKRLRPVIFDNNFIEANKILQRLEKKSESYIETLEKRFIWLVDQIL